MPKQGLWGRLSSSEGLEDLRGVFAAAQGQHGVAVAPTRVTQRVLQTLSRHAPCSYDTLQNMDREATAYCQHQWA
jgi:hypothetical protein